MGEIQSVPRRTAIAFVGIAIWLILIAFVRRLSIDESQYVAATALVARGLIPYRDFAYLQTPLQPFVFAPLAWLFSRHLLLAMRLANALLGLLTVGLVYSAARRVGATERGSLAAAAMLATCESFTWCSGVARNDMLPAALMMAALRMLVLRPGLLLRFAAGLAFGLAASAKISYAVPSATVFFAAFFTRDPKERREALVFAGGVAAGLLPTLLLAMAAPQAFLTEAIIFPAVAPTQYYTEIGKAWRLGGNRFLRLLIAAAIGPALIAGIQLAVRSWQDQAGWLGDPRRRIPLAASIGGLISAALNKPFQIFYLLPAVPPLFVLAALLFGERSSKPLWLKAIWGISIFAGIVPVGAWIIKAVNAGAPAALDQHRRAAALGRSLSSLKIDGPVATMATDYLPGASAEIDPRFAAGPFLFRTHDFISVQQASAWNVATRDRPEVLWRSPPAAIVTGDYPDVQPQQEMQLADQARALGYRPVAKAAGLLIWARRP